MPPTLLDTFESAFKDVTRLGGRSWTDARMLDLLSTPEAEPRPNHREDDRSWRDVAADAGWDPDAAIGGWPFLDAIGLRYYLAAALRRALSGNVCSSLAFQLTPPFKPSHRERFLARWLFDADQQAVMLRIAEHLRDEALARGDETAFDEWALVLERWKDVSPPLA